MIKNEEDIMDYNKIMEIKRNLISLAKCANDLGLYVKILESELCIKPKRSECLKLISDSKELDNFQHALVDLENCRWVDLF